MKLIELFLLAVLLGLVSGLNFLFPLTRQEYNAKSKLLSVGRFANLFTSMPFAISV